MTDPVFTDPWVEDDNDLLVAFEVIRELRAEIAELKAALVEMAVLP